MKPDPRTAIPPIPAHNFKQNNNPNKKQALMATFSLPHSSLYVLYIQRIVTNTAHNTLLEIT